MVKIGIIGGGFSGLGCAYYLKELAKSGNHELTIFEHNDHVGGLASGFKEKNWEWPVDRVIHHWFMGEPYAVKIANEIGMGNKLIFRNTKSSCYYNGKIAELDSALSVLKFPFLTLPQRIRMGLVLALLRLDKNYLRYENETAFSFIQRTMGKKVFDMMWKPLFLGKFGKYAPDVNAAWFWSRVHPRTKTLVYIEGGFQTYADRIAQVIKENNGTIFLNSSIKKVSKIGEKFEVMVGKKKHVFDVLVLAVPLQVAIKMFEFPKNYISKQAKLKSIGAQYFVLELKEKFFKDGTYWLNVNDASFPFMMVAEHTNFVSSKHYGGHHLIWVGKYLDNDNPLWHLSDKEFLEKVIPYLKKINPSFDKSWIVKSFFTRFENAQPVMPLGYSKKIPSVKTPIDNLYIATMNHIYPSDRGTNYALGLGHDIAQIIRKKLS